MGAPARYYTGDGVVNQSSDLRPPILGTRYDIVIVLGFFALCLCLCCKCV